MAIQTINLGSYANDGTGDDLRTAFQKVNANFAQLGASEVHDGANLGGGVGVFFQRNNNAQLEFKTLTSEDSSVLFTTTDTTIDLASQTTLENDPMPTVVAPVFSGSILTNPFNLNNNRIINGDAQTTIFGLDFRITNSLVELLIASNSVDIDFGSFLIPTGTSGLPGDKGYIMDMNGLQGPNGFIGVPDAPQIDFGTF